MTTTTGEQITVTDICGRCMGHRDAFRRYRTLNGGVCFQCEGTGVISVTYTPEEQRERQYDHRKSMLQLMDRIAMLLDYQKTEGGCGPAIAFHLFELKSCDPALYERALPRALRHLPRKLHNPILDRIDELEDEADRNEAHYRATALMH